MTPASASSAAVNAEYVCVVEELGLIPWFVSLAEKMYEIT